MNIKRILYLLSLLLITGAMASAQSGLLQCGPMVCYSEMREVLVWVQTNEPAEVHIRYWEKGNPGEAHVTDRVRTRKERAFTAKLVADTVEPGKRYEYELYINGHVVQRPYPLQFQTQVLWQWRGDPPPVKIAVGSCAYINDRPYDRPGKPYGGDYKIFTSMYEKHPDMMLWLGVNVYLREPDWNTWTGITYRYTHDRSIPEMQPFLGSVHHYAIWDDHDFGPNNSDRGLWNKDMTLKAFKLFWGNPSFGVNGKPGITTTFQWSDVQFFLLDDRYYRTPNRRRTGPRTILGEEQFEWLIDALVSSQATFKIIAIGGQVLNPVARYENYATYAEERNRLIEAITKEQVRGVLFLTGDRHHTELTALPRSGSYTLYDLTVSPLTSGSHDASKEANYLRVPGTLVGEQNFAVLEVKGPRKNRVMTMRIYDVDGKELWSRSIKAKELR
ncbi:MAG: alkaline phosphatase family protein [Chlorobi bacterium]|nr:alkaline phosphatase family protein [Chlorobiota bacterium]